MDQKNCRFDSLLSDLVEVNPSFDKCNVKIAYTEANRNNTSISKEAFESSIKTLWYVPIVANYMKEADEIGGHDFDFIDKNGKLAMIALTEPVGVIPENAPWYWETIEDESGSHEYLCTQGLIWKRQAAYSKLKEDGATKLSMEITIKKSVFENGILTIEDFYFTALTLLGDKHEPCFESAGIEMFTKDYFNEKKHQMMEDFKKEFSKEDETMDNQEKNTENEAMENAQFEESTVETTNESNDEQGEKEFSLNLNDFIEEIRSVLSQETYVSRWGDECTRFLFVDIQDSEVIYIDRKDEYRVYGAMYTMDGDKVSIDLINAKRKKIKYLDFEDGENLDGSDPSFVVSGVFTQVQEDMKNKNEELNAQYESAKAELDELKPKYEAMVEADNQRLAEIENQAKQKVFEKFDTEISGVEEYEALKSSDLKSNEIEEKCYAILGKQKANFSTNANSSVVNVVGNEENQEVRNTYGNLFDFKKK